MRRASIPLVLLVALLTPWPVLADVAASVTGGEIGAETGEQVYRHVCQGCHMPDGRGAVGAAAFPALAKNPKLDVAGYPITMVLNGHGDMPWFRDMLTDAQIAEVVNYIRGHFGNDEKDAVTPADVAALRGPAPSSEP